VTADTIILNYQFFIIFAFGLSAKLMPKALELLFSPAMIQKQPEAWQKYK
jgi:hypothetical protein